MTVLYHRYRRRIAKSTSDSLAFQCRAGIYVESSIDPHMNVGLRTANPRRERSNTCSNSEAINSTKIRDFKWLPNLFDPRSGTNQQ